MFQGCLFLLILEQESNMMFWQYGYVAAMFREMPGGAIPHNEDTILTGEEGMNKLICIAALAVLITTASTSSAATYVVMNDDLGFYYAGHYLCDYANNHVFGLTVYLSNGNSYGELVGWGILFYSSNFNVMTLTVFETVRSYGYTMVGYWMGNYAHMLYCNTYGTSSNTYLHLLSLD